MSTSLIYHTQGIVGFQHERLLFSEGKAVQRISRREFRCPLCHTGSVSTYPLRERLIQGLPYGTKPTYFRVTVHRIYCPKCKQSTVEKLPFLSHSEARQTQAFERSIIELRRDMSISAISRHYDIAWSSVKEIEKRHLQKKFAHIPLKKVKVIGIDEIAIGRIGGRRPAYWTIVRDLESGAVLCVDKGKDGDSLHGFLKRLRRSKAKIELVAMDMGKSFVAWVKENLPDTQIVFDHFHVIKMMNEKLDAVRRKTMARLDDDERRILKNKRFLLLQNQEDLNENAVKELEELKTHFKELADIYMMKEALRSIYRTAMSVVEAETALQDWCKKALLLQSVSLHKMVKSIVAHWEGILGYWKYDGLTSAGMEGFNNKIRTLIRQAYGYRDEEYMKLKIFDLPNKRCDDGI